MTNRIVPVSFLLALLLLLAPPVAASLALTSESYTPDPPLVTGGQQHLDAKFYISPSGATTFSRNHELQMQTGFQNARWNIQVILDGRNAAQQGASGSAAFVNGALLSYSTSHDLSLEVTLDGTVPPAQNGPVMVLQVEELDNAGNVVPGSVITLSQPIAGQTLAVPPTTFPSLTPPPVPVSPLPTQASGFNGILGSAALGTFFVFWSRWNA